MYFFTNPNGLTRKEIYAYLNYLINENDAKDFLNNFGE